MNIEAPGKGSSPPTQRAPSSYTANQAGTRNVPESPVDPIDQSVHIDADAALVIRTARRAGRWLEPAEICAGLRLSDQKRMALLEGLARSGQLLREELPRSLFDPPIVRYRAVPRAAVLPPECDPEDPGRWDSPDWSDPHRWALGPEVTP